MATTGLTGRVFGSLTVVGRTATAGRARWHCTCACGGTADVVVYDLTRDDGNGTARCAACREAGRVYALPADLDAVRAAYDAIPCDDDYPASGTIDDVFEAGGVYVSDRPAAK